MTEARSDVTPERLMQMVWGFAPPLAIEAAVRHGVFDALDKAPMALDELARVTRASPRGIAAVANLLVGLGLLGRDAGDRHTLTPESEAFLVSGKPAFRGGIFRHMSRQLIPNWIKLDEIVATGAPVGAFNQNEGGAAFFEQFVEDLFSVNYDAARTLAAHLDLARVAGRVSILDLAAGSGVWGIALAQSAPHAVVRAVDWPQVLPVTRRVVDRLGLSPRFTYVAGDLASADFGEAHRVATLGHILHSEGEQRSRVLLKKTFEALAPGGTIVIAELLVDEGRRGPLSGLVFAINMLVHTEQGGTYTFNEIAEWLREAGFVDVRQVPAPAPSPLVLATKAG